MNRFFFSLVAILFVVAFAVSQPVGSDESKSEYQTRMQWWNEARFGLFLHWGLYSIPAGKWKGETDHAEWIRTTAHIPVDEYDKFVSQFNPVKFDAEKWVQMASDAGMKYIVITSKHHDGFCLFDSKYTDFDVMSTPFKRDILKELSEACKKRGMKLCFYYSIMDWHNPDYLPRRDWETTRTAAGADFERFVQYVKNQVKELLTNYGDLGVLWFDGNWEDMWNNERGKDLYRYVRSLSPNIIVNDRVGHQSGLTFTEKDIVGDYRTPEQMIPATGLPDTYWETCMTMNDHWGYNSHDNNWKSSKELIQKLADIASKGGNFLLNIGPTAEGVFPDASMERLKEIGQWMKINGDAIYGTTASPFSNLQWGRCTKKEIDGGTRLFLHVFDFPSGGKLVVPGIANSPQQAFMLSDNEKHPLKVTRSDDALVVQVPPQRPDSLNSVVVLDVQGKPDVFDPPAITAPYSIFINERDVEIKSTGQNGEVRYTLDGSVPTIQSELVNGTIRLNKTTTVSARWFRDGNPLSETSQMTFTKVTPYAATLGDNYLPGIHYRYYVGIWDSLPDFGKLTPLKEGTMPNFSLSPHTQPEYFGFVFTGYIKIEKEDVYSFYTSSDDGSRLYIDDSLVVDNDQLHPMLEAEGAIALAAGLHPFRVTFFQKTGEIGLVVSMKSEKSEKQVISDGMLFHPAK